MKAQARQPCLAVACWIVFCCQYAKGAGNFGVSQGFVLPSSSLVLSTFRPLAESLSRSVAQAAGCAGKSCWAAIGSCDRKERGFSMDESERGLSDKGALMSSSAHKVVKSALVVMPPPEAWIAIQRVRMVHDKSYYRWPPHLNVLYPFLPDDATGGFRKAAQFASEALAGTKPFTLPLVEMSHFQHSKKSCTLWLDPGQDSPLQHLSDALVAAFPHCTDLRSDPKRGIARFAPHLSLGGFAGMDALDDAKRDIEAQDYWSEKQEEFEVKSVFMISRMGYDDPFKVRFEIPLGFGAGSEREINLSYVAAPGAQEEGLEERFKKMPRPGSKEHQAWNLKGKPWGLFEQTERVLSRTS